jgi:hypothetical protein
LALALFGSPPEYDFVVFIVDAVAIVLLSTLAPRQQNVTPLLDRKSRNNTGRIEILLEHKKHSDKVHNEPP